MTIKYYQRSGIGTNQFMLTKKKLATHFSIDDGERKPISELPIGIENVQTNAGDEEPLEMKSMEFGDEKSEKKTDPNAPLDLPSTA